MIEVNHLTKLYGDKLALQDVSFHVDSGEILGLLGLNGAGKSTIMNIMTGYLSATEGTVTIDGHDIVQEPLKAKRAIGYLPEQFVFYNDMRVSEYLDFICDLKRVTKDRKAHVDELCKKVGIDHITGRMVRNLSKGYRQRVGLAQALIGSPKVLILDEPTVGLDPSQLVEIRALIKEIGKTSTVIISSHILSEIQNICTRIIMLHGGRLVANDTTRNLTHTIGVSNRVIACIQGEPEKVKKVLKGMANVKFEELGPKDQGACEYIIESTNDRDIRAELFRILAKGDLPLLDTHRNEYSLEDMFLHMVKDQKDNVRDEAPAKGGN